MLNRPVSRALTVAGILGVAGFATSPAAAQPDRLVIDSSPTIIEYSGSFEDFIVPDVVGSILGFEVSAGDGGDVATGPNSGCEADGGQGVTATMLIRVAYDTRSFAPGGPLRFVVGEAGEDGIGPGDGAGKAGGGGGGSALLYTPSPQTATFFQPIIIAGGGGGARGLIHIVGCQAFDGKDGETGGSGSDGVEGGDGGSNGQGGEGTSEGTTSYAGGGGGWLTAGGGGADGGSAGLFTGGPGGSGDQNGGFGFGGGGGGYNNGGSGGGGGYSGGGGGGRLDEGGAGGSFTFNEFAISEDAINLVRNSPESANGRIAYWVFGQTHDERDAALPIPVDNAGVVRISGLTLAAWPSPVDGAPNDGPDVWYTYTNPSDTCSQSIRLVMQPTVDLIAIGDDGVPTRPNGLVLERVLAPNERLDLRVASDTGFVLIGGTVGDLDFDGDGVCDDVDVCPTIDDALVDFLADVDSDGLPDVCDRLCPEDVVPDGVIDNQDILQVAIVTTLGTDEDALQFDIDGSGVFEYFDGCE
ncbi:MAG: hypothetical protein AAFR76_10135 [Planctomycetota bacterium]